MSEIARDVFLSSGRSTFSCRGRGDSRSTAFERALKMYNVFGDAASRDIQNNITSPDFGTSYNPIERSIGFVFGAAMVASITGLVCSCSS